MLLSPYHLRTISVLSPCYLRTIFVSPPCHLRIYMFGLDTDLVRGWYGADMNLSS